MALLSVPVFLATFGVIQAQETALGEAAFDKTNATTPSAGAENFLVQGENSRANLSVSIGSDRVGLKENAESAANSLHGFLRGSHNAASGVDDANSSASNDAMSEEVDILFAAMLENTTLVHGQGAPPITPVLDVNELIRQIDDMYTRTFEQFSSGLKADEFCRRVVYHWKDSWFGDQVNIFCSLKDCKYGPHVFPSSDSHKVREQEYHVNDCFGLCNKDYAVHVAPRGVRWSTTNLGCYGWKSWGFYGRGDHSGNTVNFY